MESQPLYREGILERTINGVLCKHKLILVQSEFLPMVMNSLEDAEEYSVVDFQEWVVLVSAPFGDAVTLAWNWLSGSALRPTATKHRA